MTTAKQANLAQLGPKAWAELHAWATSFKEKVGDSCGCGDFAVSAAQAVHDMVNVHLNKSPMYSDNLRQFAAMAQGVVAKVNDEHASHSQSKSSGSPQWAAWNGVLYHGCSRATADKIRREGLLPPKGTGAGWFMVTTKRDVGVFFSRGEPDKASVVTFKLPLDKMSIFLWDKAGVQTSWGDWQFAIKGIPPEYVMAVDDVTTDEWMEVHGRLMTGAKASQSPVVFSQAFMERVMAIPKEQLGFGDEWMKDDGPTAQPVKVVESRDDAKYKLFPFQTEGVRLLEGKQAAILADQPGLGKTSQAIVWATPHRPVLVLVPASLVYNWEYELTENWRRNDTVRVIDVNTPWTDDLADWTILSYGQVQTLGPQIRAAKFETLLLDEAHNIRNWDTDRTQGIMDLVDPPTANSPKYRLLITGTPVVNTEEDILSYLVVLGDSAVKAMGIDPSSVGLTLHQWIDSARRIFASKERVPGEKDALRRKWQTALQKIMVRRMKDDVLKDLPPKSHTLLPVALTNAEEYERAKHEFEGYIRGQTGRKVSSAVALQKLSALRGLSALGKVSAVAAYLKSCDAGGEKTLVFSSHIEPLEQLQDMRGGLLYTGGLSKGQRQDYVKKFQKGGACFFLGTYGAAGVGITLTAAHRVVLLDLPWTPADKQQAEDRVHRIGQKETVQIVTVIGKNTIDERVLEILSEKEQLVGQIVDGMSAGDASQASIATDVLKRVRKGEWGQGSRHVPRYVGDAEMEARRKRRRNDPDEVLYHETKQPVFTIDEPAAVVGPDVVLDPSVGSMVPEDYTKFRVDSRLVRDPGWDVRLAPVLNRPSAAQVGDGSAWKQAIWPDSDLPFPEFAKRAGLRSWKGGDEFQLTLKFVSEDVAERWEKIFAKALGTRARRVPDWQHKTWLVYELVLPSLDDSNLPLFKPQEVHRERRSEALEPQAALFSPVGTPPPDDDDDGDESDDRDYGAQGPWNQRLPLCTPEQQETLERCILDVKAKGGDANPWAVCQSQMGCRRRYKVETQQRVVLSSALLDTLAHGAVGAVGATIGATIAAKAIGGGATAVTSPEAAIRVIDDRAENKDGDTVRVVNPGHVDGDQADVDVGSLLQDLDKILRDPSKWGEINPDTQKVIREGAPA